MPLKHSRWLPVLLGLVILGVGCGPKGPFPSLKGFGSQPKMAAPPLTPSPPPVEVVAAPETAAPSEENIEAPQPEPETPKPAAETPQVLYADSFADVRGSIHWNKSGVKTAEGAPNQRTVFTFMGLAEGGPLTMQIFEDNKTQGPDGESGVLALSWQELPPKLPYSGFVYLGGGPIGRMSLPPLKDVRLVEDLRGIRLKFKYKGANVQSDAPVKLKFNCRLEPFLPESFARRLEFGNHTATDEWATFDMPLVEGKNMEAFLRSIAEESPPQFKIVFGQAGPLADYHNGDTLLIDDIEVSQ